MSLPALITPAAAWTIVLTVAVMFIVWGVVRALADAFDDFDGEA